VCLAAEALVDESPFENITTLGVDERVCHHIDPRL
jgi:hypothetical protein